MGAESRAAASARRPPLIAAARLAAWRFPAAIGAACFAAVALTTASVMSVDGYFDLYAGRIVAAHGLPHHDTITLAGQGRAWVDQQWLAQLLLYRTWEAGGYPALGLLAAALAGGSFALLGAGLRRRGCGPWTAAAACGAAFAVCLPTAIIWAQAFALPLFVAVLWAVLADAEGRPLPGRLASRCIPLLVLWANLHGSALLGAAAVAAYAGVRALRARAWAYAVLAAAAAASPLATPYGWAIVGYYRSVLQNPVVARLDAWQPAGPDTVASYPFLVLLAAVAAVVAAAVRTGHRPRWAAGVAVTALGLAGIASLRYEQWFAVVAAVVLADALAHLAARRAPARNRLGRPLASAALAAGAVSAAFLAARSDAAFERTIPRRAIAAAAAYAATHPGARILADTSSATPLLWLDAGARGRVGFDSRIEVFPPAAAGAWLDFNAASRPGWARLAGGYDVIVASRRAHPLLARRAASLPGWRVLYSGADGVVSVTHRERG